MTGLNNVKHNDNKCLANAKRPCDCRTCDVNVKKFKKRG